MQDGQRYFMVRYRPRLDFANRADNRPAGKNHWLFLVETSGDRDPLPAMRRLTSFMLPHLHPDGTISPEAGLCLNPYVSRVVEEAAEAWMAAEHEGKDATALEISQLLYHAQVLMLASGLTLDDVYAHL